MSREGRTQGVFWQVVYWAHQCIAVYLLQVFMEDVVTAFTTNRITTEEGLAKANMKYMVAIPDGGEWEMFFILHL